VFQKSTKGFTGPKITNFSQELGIPGGRKGFFIVSALQELKRWGSLSQKSREVGGSFPGHTWNGGRLLERRRSGFSKGREQSPGPNAKKKCLREKFGWGAVQGGKRVKKV